MRTTKKIYTVLGLSLFILLFTLQLNAQKRTNCFRVDLDRVGDMPDSIRSNFPSTFLIPDQQIIDFLNDQLRQFPEIMDDLEPPAPHFSIYGHQNLNIRWDTIPNTEKPDYFLTSVLNLQLPQTITQLPADTTTGIAIPISLGFIHQVQLVSFISVKGNQQSVLDIIIIDKDAAINCESSVISSGESLSEEENNTNNNADPSILENGSLQVFPNPTYDWSVLCFHLPLAGEVHIELFHSLSGRRVAILEDHQHFPAGDHQVYTNSEDLPAGQYTCIMHWNGQVTTEHLFKTGL